MASGLQTSTEGKAAECGKRGAIAESLGTIESAYAAAKRTEQRASLLAQVVDIEKRISELQPVLYGSCPDDLGITALSARLKRVNAAINQAVETDRRRQEAEATPCQEKIEECAKRSAVATHLATIESAHAAAKSTEQQESLLAQIVDIEKPSRNSNRSCTVTALMISGSPLSGRLERVQAEIKQAVAMERRRQEAEAARRREEIDAARRRQEIIAATERRRQEINAKQWPETIKQAVLAQRVQIGMTTEQVTASWGRPQQVNETITSTTRHEQWVYPGWTYLYFTNGTLTMIQRRR